jgi:hypothetical protein
MNEERLCGRLMFLPHWKILLLPSFLRYVPLFDNVAFRSAAGPARLRSCKQITNRLLPDINRTPT